MIINYIAKLKKQKYNNFIIIKRSMFNNAFKISNRIVNQNLQHPTRGYAVFKVHDKPNIAAGSEDSFRNNPVVKTSVMVKGKPKVVYTRHPELSASLCSFPGCNKKVCDGLCAKALESKPQSVGHVTHGNKGDVKPFHNKDLNNNEKPENIVVYKQPHETSGEINTEKTKTLQTEDRSSKLEKLLNETNKTDD